MIRDCRGGKKKALDENSIAEVHTRKVGYLCFPFLNDARDNMYLLTIWTADPELNSWRSKCYFYKAPQAFSRPAEWKKDLCTFVWISVVYRLTSSSSSRVPLQLWLTPLCTPASLLPTASRWFPPLVSPLFFPPGPRFFGFLVFWLSRAGWPGGRGELLGEGREITQHSSSQPEKSENEGEVLTKACFIITDYTSIKHLSLHERSPEECFPPENTFISRFNPLQSLILIDPNPWISTFNKWASVKLVNLV